MNPGLHADGSPRSWDGGIPATLTRLRTASVERGDDAPPAREGLRRLLDEDEPLPEGGWHLARYADSGLVVATQSVRGRTMRVWARFGAGCALDLRVEIDGVALLEGGVPEPGPPPSRWSLRGLLERRFRPTGPRLAGARAQGRKARIEGTWGPARRIVRLDGTRVVVLDTLAAAPGWTTAGAVPGVEVRTSEPHGAAAARWRTVLEWRPPR